MRRPIQNCWPDLHSIYIHDDKEAGMEVEVIYRQQDGTRTPLGTRRLSHMPPIGEPFLVDNRQYLTAAYLGPDAEGRYQLFLEDESAAPLQ